MSRCGSLVRLVGPVVVLYLMGCADSAQADLVAPNEQAAPAAAPSGCASNPAGPRTTMKCADVTLKESGQARLSIG